MRLPEAPRQTWLILLALVVIKLALHFATNHRYGFHGDELYFIACGEHLDWGYVDHSPMVAVIAKVQQLVFGESLRALRVFPALAGAAMLILLALMVQALGGRTFAVGLAGLCYVIAPLYLRSQNMLTIVAFDQLFWVLACYLLIRWIQTRKPGYWIALGVAMGLGLMTKHSMLFFGFGLAVGLAATPLRRSYLTPGPWLAALTAFALFAPNVVWQVQHGWPTLEFLRNINESRMARISAVEFSIGQIVYLHPFTFPVWVAGLAWFFRARSAQDYRIFGWMFVAIFLLLATVKSKIYYLGPIYPILLAGGGVAWERLSGRPRWGWTKPVLSSFIALGGIALLPLSLPVLSLSGFQKYADAFKWIVPNASEGDGDIRSMLGHPEKISAVASGYGSLSEEEKQDCALVGGSYSHAGAIDFFGEEHGLPKSISGHNSYWLWGPRDYSLEKIITLGVPEGECRAVYSEVREVARFRVEYRPGSFNKGSVFFCRGLTIPREDLWREARHYD